MWKTIPQKQFREILAEVAKHEEESGDVLSLVAYNNKIGENVIPVEADCRFTTNALFRLDYRWPIIDNPYLEKVIRALDTLDFFADQI